MKLKSVKDLKVGGKTVLVRAGFDVPMKDGRILDDARIRAALATLKLLDERKAKMVIITHLGRPESWDILYSLKPAAKHLAELWQRKFVVIPSGTSRLPEYDIPHMYFFEDNFMENDIVPLLAQMKPRDAAVLENLRFYPGEKANDADFAKKLASFGDFYVNEAFSNSHRADASMAGLPALLPATAGLDLLKEISALEQVLKNPRKPLILMMGGVKLSDKEPALANLGRKADNILVGGGLANLLLKVKGYKIGKSVQEEGEDKLAREILRNLGDKLILPSDLVVSTGPDGPAEVVGVEKVKPHQMILDLGPETILKYSSYLKSGQTLVWAGPLGLFEKKQFSHATYALGRLFASRTKSSAFGVAGGGETLEAIHNLGMEDYIDHVSTGGGAMLDFLAGEKLPALEPLEN